MFVVRFATPSDVIAMIAIQREAFPNPVVHETPETFNAIMNVTGAIALVIEKHDTICGYILSHPTNPNTRHLLQVAPSNSDNNIPGWFYIHDLCIAESSRGHGLGRILFDAYLDILPRPLKGLTVIAINCADGFWERMGFILTDERDECVMASYGGPCKFGIREFT